MDALSYRTVKGRLRVYAGAGPDEDGEGPESGQAADAAGGRWRARLARACARPRQPGSLPALTERSVEA
jgi:hypothetical protein